MVNLGVINNTAVTIPRGQINNLKASYTLNSPVLEAPLTRGQAVGTVNFQLNGKTIEQKPLVVMDEVKEGGFISRIWDFISLQINTLFKRWFG